MSRCDDDVRLLGDLDALIEMEERLGVMMNGVEGQMLSHVLFPKRQGLHSVGSEIFVAKVDVLKRTRARLGELLEQEHQKGD